MPLLVNDDFISRIVNSVNADDLIDPFEDIEPLELESDVPLDPVARLTATAEPARSVPSTGLGEHPSLMDQMTTTKEERKIAKDIYEKSTPGSAGSFQAAQAATGMSPESWFKKWGGGPSGDLSGFIPEKALIQVAPGHYLKPDAAKNFKAMLRAARKDGVNISYTDTYRDYQTQVETKQAKGAYAATPGNSNHGWGMAVDFNVNDPKVKAWLDKNGKRFGWVNPLWAHDGEGIEEPWHWEYVGGGKKVRVKAKPKPHKGHDHPDPLDNPLNKLDGSSVAQPSIVFGALLAEVNDPEAVPEPADAKDKNAPSAKGLKFVPRQYRGWIMEAAEKSGLSPRLIAYVMQKESSFSADIVNFQRDSSAGARGPMQIMPFWSSTYGDKIFRDPRANVIAGAKILAAYINQQGNLREGLAAYNAGPGNLSAGLDYANDILNSFLGRAA